MAYGSSQGKRKKIKKVNHMNSTQIREKLVELKAHSGSKYYQHMLARDRAYSRW